MRVIVITDAKVVDVNFGGKLQQLWQIIGLEQPLHNLPSKSIEVDLFGQLVDGLAIFMW